MAITVLLGATGAGKSTELIKMLRQRRAAGRRAVLYLADHPFLTSRPNVKAGGFMGCRTAGLHFPITDVLTDHALAATVANANSGDLVAIDEAQCFDATIVPSLVMASDRGVDIVIGMPSEAQLHSLQQSGATMLEVNHAEKMVEFAEMLQVNPPFPGERHAYQPLFGVTLEGFKYVREDCPIRLKLALAASRRALGFTQQAPEGSTYLDVGCCSGYFVEGMASAGFKAMGVDVQKVFVNMAQTLSAFRDSGTEYVQQNAFDFSLRDLKFDVVSTFATIQWVMVQRGYQDGYDTLVRLMNMCGKVFVLEMGYTSEDIYKGKIDIVIDREWTENILKNEGGFKSVQFFKAGHEGLWRDLFIATR